MIRQTISVISVITSLLFASQAHEYLDTLAYTLQTRWIDSTWQQSYLMSDKIDKSDRTGVDYYMRYDMYINALIKMDIVMVDEDNVLARDIQESAQAILDSINSK
ncbi:MAG: hypothetical protein NZM04_05595 [Methylacidiphilales bacterium]|nr:hypothetical protein [Candidatus Methylacidiphilales bacterium]